jgi:hypothetical protein
MHTSPIEVQKALKDMDYPASKKEIIKHAKKHDARKEVIEDLDKLPEKEYKNAAEVSKGFKGD